MRNTILITYILISSASIWLLDNSLRDAQSNIDILAESITSHDSVLRNHKSAIQIILESIRGLYT